MQILTAKGMHRLLYFCNGVIIFTLMGFMCVTQERINNSMSARAFLELAGAIPQSSGELFFQTIISFVIFALSGHYYLKTKILKCLIHICITFQNDNIVRGIHIERALLLKN